ncbi:hypothetical protein PFICI_05479 [Pestalotiopsis fici W106-1]|uniref:Uncharacterized protein n=1 Tax=Pestalotiopsis fici (strain W106-1 / CGMCC3.15140) TaxID=1229662 RepID=W3XBZ1_PESFW|nr:uncharacterized protein PFICI_05479 [Pestalotiopsis fici W106-1]ETS83603.1 hypothetical protein PFICI_05479 [Pestalotiopsis fici W106-1]
MKSELDAVGLRSEAKSKPMEDIDGRLISEVLDVVSVTPTLEKILEIMPDSTLDAALDSELSSTVDDGRVVDSSDTSRLGTMIETLLEMALDSELASRVVEVGMMLVVINAEGSRTEVMLDSVLVDGKVDDMVGKSELDDGMLSKIVDWLSSEAGREVVKDSERLDSVESVATLSVVKGELEPSLAVEGESRSKDELSGPVSVLLVKIGEIIGTELDCWPSMVSIVEDTKVQSCDVKLEVSLDKVAELDKIRETTKLVAEMLLLVVPVFSVLISILLVVSVVENWIGGSDRMVDSSDMIFGLIFVLPVLISVASTWVALIGESLDTRPVVKEGRRLRSMDDNPRLVVEDKLVNSKVVTLETAGEIAVDGSGGKLNDETPDCEVESPSTVLPSPLDVSGVLSRRDEVSSESIEFVSENCSLLVDLGSVGIEIDVAKFGMLNEEE